MPEERRMEFRIGINLGDVMLEDDDIFGEGVNVAARLQELAQPGGICISGTVFDQVKNKLTLGYVFQGEQSVKNISEPVPVYRVHLDQSAMPDTVRDRQQRDSPQQVEGNETTAQRRGNVPGDVVFSEDTNFRGNIGGSVTVRRGVSLVQRGNIDRDLIIERDAGVKLRGNIGGNVRNKGGRLEHRGNLMGSELHEDNGTAQDSGTDDDDRRR